MPTKIRRVDTVSVPLILSQTAPITRIVSDNEQFVGEAIRKSGIPRNEIFLTTKLWCVLTGFTPFMQAELDVGLEQEQGSWQSP